MKVLHLVHCESAWQDDMTGDFHYKLAMAIGNPEISRIYVLNSGVNESREQSGLLPVIDGLLHQDGRSEEVSFSWGYEGDYQYSADEDLDEDGNDPWVIEGSSAHGYTWIPYELRELSPADEHLLIGGCDSECLQDYRCILDHLGCQHTTLAYF